MDSSDLGFVDTARNGSSASNDQTQRTAPGASSTGVWPRQADIANIAGGGGSTAASGVNNSARMPGRTAPAGDNNNDLDDDDTSSRDEEMAMDEDEDDDDDPNIFGEEQQVVSVGGGRMMMRNGGARVADYLLDMEEDEIGRDATLSPLADDGKNFDISTHAAASGYNDASVVDGMLTTSSRTAGQNLSSANDIKIVDVGSADVDIDSLVQSYTGLTRIKHLRFIALRCPRLRREALRTAMQYVKAETDMYREYELLAGDLAAMDSGGAGVASSSGASSQSTANLSKSKDVQSTTESRLSASDSYWVEKKRTEAQTRFERLDLDLKNYKANAIKESTRRGYIDLGDYYMRIGEVDNAIRQYVKSRDYASDIKHLINVYEKILKAAVINQSWGHVENYAAMLESALESSPHQQQQQSSSAQQNTSTSTEDAGGTGESGGGSTSAASSGGGQSLRDLRYRASVEELRKLALGLRFFADSNYAHAADFFLALNPDHLHFDDHQSGQQQQQQQSSSSTASSSTNISELIAPKDIALYGLLCALTTRTRAELKQKVFPGAGSGGGSGGTSSGRQSKVTQKSAEGKAKSSAAAGAASRPQAAPAVSTQQQQIGGGFKSFLAEEPAARVIAESYRDGNYNECIGLLQRNKCMYLLDPFLSPHITTLIDCIRQKGMVEYFCAYKKVFIATMARDFVVAEEQLENELVRLICDGKMNAYIDMSDRSLRRREVDSAAENKAKLVELLKQSEQVVTRTLLHVDLLRNNIALPEEKPGSHHQPHHHSQQQQQQQQSHQRSSYFSGSQQQMLPGFVGGGNNNNAEFEGVAGVAEPTLQQAPQQQQRKGFFSNITSMFGASGSGSSSAENQQKVGDASVNAGGGGRPTRATSKFFVSAASSATSNSSSQQQSGPVGAAGHQSSFFATSSANGSVTPMAAAAGGGGENVAAAVGGGDAGAAAAPTLTSKDSGMSLDTIDDDGDIQNIDDDDADVVPVADASSAGGVGGGAAATGGDAATNGGGSQNVSEQHSSSSGGGGSKTGGGGGNGSRNFFGGGTRG